MIKAVIFDLDGVLVNTKHIHLKNEIELSQQSYEKLIDEATNEISNFVKKANLGNLS